MAQILFGTGIRALHAAQQRMALSRGHAVVLVIVGTAQFRVEAQPSHAVAALDLEADAAVALTELLDVHLPHQLPPGQAVDGERLGIPQVRVAQCDPALLVIDGGSRSAFLHRLGRRPVGRALHAARHSAPDGEADCHYKRRVHLTFHSFIYCKCDAGVYPQPRLRSLLPAAGQQSLRQTAGPKGRPFPARLT